MNRLFFVRHGGSTANEDGAFYSYNDSAICLTTNGIRQALATAQVLSDVAPRWLRAGDFAVEAYASEYTRTQQTARIVLDQMNLHWLKPLVRSDLNERDYGLKYEKRMDQDATYAGQDSESGTAARRRVRGFLTDMESILHRADVIAFSHFGTIRALIANLLDLSDDDMMRIDVQNGAAYLFTRTFDGAGKASFVQQHLADPVLPKSATLIKPPVAPPPS